jgi:probable rRNA maturation factor
LATITFNNNGITPGIRLTGEIKNFLASIFENEGAVFTRVTYIFCKDDYVLALNTQYLNHPVFTDILTFILSEPGKQIIAEIYISIERVTENAILLKIPYQDELFRVMIHGILHLCGYHDKTLKQRVCMRTKEDEYLSSLMFHVKRST